MNATKVEYTINEEFVEQNKKNIQTVIEELKSSNVAGLQYSSWIKEDGKSFVHIVFQETDVENPLPGLESFKHFQKELKENLEKAPEVTKLGLVGRD